MFKTIIKMLVGEKTLDPNLFALWLFILRDKTSGQLPNRRTYNAKIVLHIHGNDQPQSLG